MTYRRVRPGTGYRARLRSAVLGARDGDTIVVPGIREAVEAYCAARLQHREVDLCWHYESPWRVYQILPEWYAALRHAVLDITGFDVLINSIAQVLQPLAGHGERLADGWFYERDGIQVVVRLEPVEPSSLVLRPDCSGAVLVRPGGTLLENSLIHVGGCPVVVVEFD